MIRSVPEGVHSILVDNVGGELVVVAEQLAGDVFAGVVIGSGGGQVGGIHAVEVGLFLDGAGRVDAIGQGVPCQPGAIFFTEFLPDEQVVTLELGSVT